jgi:hypothetical protein
VDTQAGIKDRDQDLALLNSLRGKWVVYPWFCSGHGLVTVADTKEDAQVLLKWATLSCPNQLGYDCVPVAHVLVGDEQHTGEFKDLLDRLREIVNERGMVREEVRSELGE